MPDFRAGTLTRSAEWSSPAGRTVRVTSVRLASFTQRAAAAISYQVEPLDGPAHVVLQSQLAANGQLPRAAGDPRAAAVLDALLRSEEHARAKACHPHPPPPARAEGQELRLLRVPDGPGLLAVGMQPGGHAETGHLRLAHDYLGEAALIDPEDLQHNTRNGLHLASLAGSWIALLTGFGGMCGHQGMLRFAPRLPPTLTRLAFTVVTGGRRLRVETTRTAATYTLSGDGPPVQIGHHGQPITLTPGARRPATSLRCPTGPSRSSRRDANPPAARLAVRVRSRLRRDHGSRPRHHPAHDASRLGLRRRAPGQLRGCSARRSGTSSSTSTTSRQLTIRGMCRGGCHRQRGRQRHGPWSRGRPRARMRWSLEHGGQRRQRRGPGGDLRHHW